MDYDQVLIDRLNAVVANYSSQGIDLMSLKADYMAERSIPDNIT